MRANLVILALCAIATPVAADSKTRELAQGYAKEAAACQTRADGLTKVARGTQELVDDGQTQYADDLAALRAGLEQVQAYCGELAATLELLNADPAAAYRSLERKLDEHDNQIRKLRQRTKQTLDDLAPVISRMIPPINARVGSAAPAPKRVHIKFPSGRAIDAAILAGTYRTSGTEAADILDYAEAKASATIVAKLVGNATCAQQRQAIAATDATELAATEATRPLGLAWYIAFTKPGRRLRVACRPTAAGAVVVSLDDPVDASAWPELEPVLVAMIAARS
jgi:uncharacterized phage infection (PIP) family protein YhgE